MNIFRKISEKIDPMVGKTVVHFTTHGCMAHIHEFDFIGKIIGITYPPLCAGKKFYKVEVLKDNNGEKRDRNLKESFKEVASWYLQKMGKDLFIAYD
jgi:hypothetical protein